MAQQNEAVKKPVVPRGKALHRTPAEIAASCTPEAMAALAEEAAEDWRENAPRRFQTVIDTEENRKD